MTDLITRNKCRRARFVLNDKNEVVFREWLKVQKLVAGKWVEFDKKTKDTPVESLGYSKSLVDYIVLKKSIASKESYDGFDVVLFLKKINYNIRNDKPYAYLIKTSNKQTRKICVKNFDTGVTGFVGTKSDNLVIVDSSEPKPVTKEKVLEMYENGQISEIYGGTETVNGETLYKKIVYVDKNH